MNQPKIEVFKLRSGDKGAIDTVGHMIRLVNWGRQEADVIGLASDLMRGIDYQDDRNLVEAAWRYVLEHVDYRFDPQDYEFIRSPEVMLKHMAGDCDDQAVFLAALISSVASNIPLAFVLCRTGGPRSPYSHVLLSANIDGVWTPLETIRPIEMGVWPEEVTIDEKNAKFIPVTFKGEAQVGGFFKKVFKEVKRGAKKVEKQAKRSARQVERFASRTVRAFDDAAQSAFDIKNFNSLEDLVSIKHGRLKVNTRVLAAVATLNPAAFITGSKQNIKALNDLTSQIPIIGAPIFATTVDEWIAKAKAAAQFIPVPVLSQAVGEAASLAQTFRTVKEIKKSAAKRKKVMIQKIIAIKKERALSMKASPAFTPKLSDIAKPAQRKSSFVEVALPVTIGGVLLSALLLGVV